MQSRPSPYDPGGQFTVNWIRRVSHLCFNMNVSHLLLDVNHMCLYRILCYHLTCRITYCRRNSKIPARRRTNTLLSSLLSRSRPSPAGHRPLLTAVQNLHTAQCIERSFPSGRGAMTAPQDLPRLKGIIYMYIVNLVEHCQKTWQM